MASIAHTYVLHKKKKDLKGFHLSHFSATHQREIPCEANSPGEDGIAGLIEE